ncbi:MAG: hypothetical protein Q9M12_08845 [Mariprofundus sp.]|nr:hypothetical protein [Mariprofundus sp.]
MKSFLIVIGILMLAGADVVFAAVDHNTTRSNRHTSIGDANLGSDASGQSGAMRKKRIGKRKCIKNGGTFYEFASGNKACVPASKKASAPPYVDTLVLRASAKKRCWRDGGVWVTTSTGSICYRRLKAEPASF